MKPEYLLLQTGQCFELWWIQGKERQERDKGSRFLQQQWLTSPVDL
jgi:hypothetical protein